MQYPAGCQKEYMQIPDVSGYKLDNAVELLRARGMEKIIVKLTTQPRLRESGYNGSSRIIRQSSLDDGTLELLVCNINSK